LILIPVQPSPYDTWAAAEVVGFVHARAELEEAKNKSFKAAFVLNRTVSNTKISGEVAEALIEYSLPVLATNINQRIDFAVSAAKGLSILDYKPNSRGAIEISNLTAEVLELLAK